MRHAGCHWPENADGEHPTRDAILAIPGMQGAVTICSPSARYHYDAIRQYCRAATVVWRAIPRRGKLPAQLGWNADRVASECLNLWNEQPHGGTEWFLPLNELQFDQEAGESFRGYGFIAMQLGALRVALQDRFRALGQDVRLMFPAWVPQDDIERASDWVDEARRWDSVCLHAYGSAEEIGERIHDYRDVLGPSVPLFLGEWNANHTGADERDSLRVLAECSDHDPAFLGATYYIWETNNEGERDLSIWGNPARLALFRDPPTVIATAPAPAPEPAPEVPAMPERDPYEYFTAIEIANAAALAVSDVRANWPHIHAQLVLCGIADRPVQIGMIGTAAVESGMKPIHEYGTEADWSGYSGGAAYAGRGFIQVTHDYNYRALGPKIAALWATDPNQPDFDLVANPDNLLNPDLAAAAAAIFFRDTKTLQGYSIVDACRAEDWEWVRRLVYGGPDPKGTARIARVSAALSGPSVPASPPVTRVAYNASEPAHPQEESFDCSQESLEWALFSLGRHPSDDWLENTMIEEGVMSPELGLLDATGRGLAEFVTRQYQAETGIYANHEPSVTFDGVAFEGGHAYPLLIGGRRFGAGGHWCGVRGYDAARDVILLANPSHGHTGIFQEINRDQFEARGPWSMVRVLHPDLLEAIPPAPPPPEPIPLPVPDPRDRQRALLSEIKARVDELTALVG